MPLLINAIKQKRFKKIQLALQLGWNLNERDPEDLRTPLIELTFLERETVAAGLCKRFLIAGARLDLKDINGRNALHWACVKGRERLVEIFVNATDDFDINAQDCDGNTALSLAVISCNEKIVRKLITVLTRYKLSVDVRNNNGETPLILASKFQSYLLCEILTKMGKASTETRDKIRQLSPKEWKSFTETDGTVKRDVRSSFSVTLDVQELSREKISTLSRPEKNNYRNEIYRIFNLYYDELSASFRPPVIPPPKEEETYTLDLPTYYENGDSEFLAGNLETCPITPPHGKKRFSISRAAQIPLSVNRMRKSKNTAAERSAQNVSWEGRQDQGKLSRKRSIIPKLEISTIVPVVKRNSCPILQQRRTFSKDEMVAFKLGALNEYIEKEVLTESKTERSN